MSECSNRCFSYVVNDSDSNHFYFLFYSISIPCRRLMVMLHLGNKSCYSVKLTIQSTLFIVDCGLWTCPSSTLTFTFFLNSSAFQRRSSVLLSNEWKEGIMGRRYRKVTIFQNSEPTRHIILVAFPLKAKKLLFTQ